MLHPRDRVLRATDQEMSMCNPTLRSHYYECIKRVQTHSSRKVLNRQIRLAKPYTRPTAGEQCHRQVRIERKCPISKGSPRVNVTDHIGKCEPGERDRDGIILT